MSPLSVTILGDGVIVAQGGVTDGWALYVQQGEVRFATTHGSHRSVVATGEKPVGVARIDVSYAKSGRLSIAIDGEEAVTTELDGPLSTQPLDGLQVGSDTNGSVGEYRSPFALDGKVSRLVIEMH